MHATGDGEGTLNLSWNHKCIIRCTARALCVSRTRAGLTDSSGRRRRGGGGAPESRRRAFSEENNWWKREATICCCDWSCVFRTPAVKGRRIVRQMYWNKKVLHRKVLFVSNRQDHRGENFPSCCTVGNIHKYIFWIILCFAANWRYWSLQRLYISSTWLYTCRKVKNNIYHGIISLSLGRTSHRWRCLYFTWINKKPPTF